jgi:hypothetical protein
VHFCTGSADGSLVDSRAAGFFCYRPANQLLTARIEGTNVAPVARRKLQRK